MPEYDLQCEKGHKWIAYHGIHDEHGSCPTCGEKGERDFSAGVAAMDGTSQNGWPRKNMSVDREWVGGKPRVREFSSQRDMDNFYGRRGKYARREEQGKPVFLRG